MSSVWVLESQVLEDDDRGEEAKTAVFVLAGPGTYVAGRTAGRPDIDLADDKSTSRNHAEVVVPPPEEWAATGAAPFITVRGREPE